MQISPLSQCDFYKTGHYKMYPDLTTKIYSNLTPRKSRMAGISEIVVFGTQYFILEYLIKQWNENFFGRKFIHVQGEQDIYPKRSLKGHKEKVISKYKRLMDATLGKDAVDMKHIEALWDLGYMPLEIKSLPEGGQMRPH